MTDRQRLLVAGLVCASGLGIVAWNTRHILFGPPAKAAAPPRPVPALVTESIAPTVLDTTPTEASVEGDITKVAGRVQALGLAAGVRDRPDDLAKAFETQLRAVLVGDYTQHRQAMAERGLTLVDSSAAQAEWMRAAARTRLTQFGAGALKVQLVYRNGVRVLPSETAQGYRRSDFRTRLKGDPRPATEQDGRLTVVQVQLPMRLAGQPPDGPQIVLAGFRFAWNPERRQWILWEVTVLDAESGGYAAAPPM